MGGKQKSQLKIVVCLFIFICSLSNSTVVAFSNQIKTDIGIGFTSDSKTANSISDNSTLDNVANRYENVPKFSSGINGISKLPQTGELLAPIILIILGWMLIFLSLIIYIILKGPNEKGGE